MGRRSMAHLYQRISDPDQSQVKRTGADYMHVHDGLTDKVAGGHSAIERLERARRTQKSAQVRYAICDHAVLAAGGTALLKQGLL